MHLSMCSRRGIPSRVILHVVYTRYHNYNGHFDTLKTLNKKLRRANSVLADLHHLPPAPTFFPGISGW